MPSPRQTCLFLSETAILVLLFHIMGFCQMKISFRGTQFLLAVLFSLFSGQCRGISVSDSTPLGVCKIAE